MRSQTRPPRSGWPFFILRKIASCKKRGFCPSCGARRMADSAALLVDEVLAHKVGYAKPLTETGAVTLILRFGSALNLNIYQPNRDHQKM